MVRSSEAEMPDSTKKTANFYAGGLDRVSHLRKDEAWLAERLHDETSRIVPVWRGQNLIARDGEAEPRAVFLTPQEAAIADAVLLCVYEGCAYFAIDLSSVETPTEAITADSAAQFMDLRRVGPLLTRVEGSM